jgi:sulfatase maturation enzyme AslB (radical SAM superfamily)
LAASWNRPKDVVRARPGKSQRLYRPRDSVERPAAAARAQWDQEVASLTTGEAVMVRPETPYGYARASYELNLGCNYDCEHCYLGEKAFSGMDWPGRQRLLDVMAEAGVLWLQLTGGEPLVDALFPETLAYACSLGMMVQVSSNGSRLHQPQMIDLLTAHRPYPLTLSLYGATEESYDAMTRSRGAFNRFIRGLDAARDAMQAAQPGPRGQEDQHPLHRVQRPHGPARRPGRPRPARAQPGGPAPAGAYLSDPAGLPRLSSGA